MRWFAACLFVGMLASCGGGSGGGSSGPPAVSTYSVGVSISGLGVATGLALANGGETQVVPANAISFVFSTKLAPGASYGVSVASQPAGLNCTVVGGAGTVATSNVDTVSVKCEAASLTFAVLAGNLGGAGALDAVGPFSKFSSPHATATDAAGNIYVADAGNHTIRKITPAAVVSTFAGSAGASGSQDGIGAEARFSSPNGIAVDSSGNIYVADTANSTIRKITLAGVVSTLAGTAGPLGAGVGSTDGTGAAARFSRPNAVAVDVAGNVYVADTGNHTVRKITPAGVVTTLSGMGNVYGGSDGVGSLARFAAPEGIAVDGAGNVYVADTLNQAIRKITPSAVVTTIAGSVGSAGSADGIGIAATFSNPTGVVSDGGGNLYVADSSNQTIRKITSSGVVSTVAGVVDAMGGTDGAGAIARFGYPTGLSLDGAGNLYVADLFGATIRRISPAGIVSTLAGTAQVSGYADGAGAAAGFHSPEGTAVDASGNIYLADTENHTIRKITPTGAVSTLAGAPGVRGSEDGVGSVARFLYPQALAVDGSGNVYVADKGNYTIRKISPRGVVSTFAGTAGVYGTADGIGAAARFGAPRGIAADSGGNLYVTDSRSCTIRKITPAGVVSTLAGSPNACGSDDGVGASARFYYPHGIALDSLGNIYVADTINNTVRRVTAAGVVTTLAGAARVSGTADGIGLAARFAGPSGIAIDGAGNIYVADYTNQAVRKIATNGVVSTLVKVGGLYMGSTHPEANAFSYPLNLAVSGSTLYITMLNGIAVVNLP